MGYRPRPTPTSPIITTPWRHNPVAATWDRMKDRLRANPKMVGAMTLTEVGLFVGVFMDLTVLVIGTLVALCAMSGYMARPGGSVSVVEDVEVSEALSEAPPEPSCVCGSQENAAPVEVQYEPGVVTVVAHLCPDCRAHRTPKQLRVEAERIRGVENAKANMARIANDLSRGKPIPEHVDAYEHEKIRTMLVEKMAEFNAAADDVKIDGGAAHLTVAEMDRINGLAAAVTYLRDRLDKMTAHPPPGPVAPRPGLMIEQGEWVYEIPWHAEDDLCPEDDHEWESIMAAGASAPVLSVCTRCGARRRPRVVSAHTGSAALDRNVSASAVLAPSSTTWSGAEPGGRPEWVKSEPFWGVP